MEKEIVRPDITRNKALIICGVGYVFGLAVAVLVGIMLRDKNTLLMLATADIAGTVVIFILSVLMKNSSMYDPYWSVAPIPIAVYYIIESGSHALPIRQWLVLILILIWGGRLTYNWIRRWRGVHHEDWRYMNFRRRFGKAYWPISFLGIHLFPTIMVFMACLPLYSALYTGNHSFWIMDIIAVVVTGGAVLIETISDRQLLRFMENRSSSNEILQYGLWKYSRHPNYFGEVLFWWGMYLFGVAANPGVWWMIFAPIAMTVMFFTVSVPMIDKRMVERKPEYAEVMRTTSGLMPWFRKG